MFVRYVSHEIRTPLNTTLLGLNLLGSEVTAGDVEPAVLSDLIQDATGSCMIAIDILNDLLMYEKIDGGLLDLERAETKVWPFVEDVLKVFLIQVNVGAVKLFVFLLYFSTITQTHNNPMHNYRPRVAM